MRLRRWIVVTPIAALGAWLSLAAWWTYGFRAFTSFSFALVAAGPLPRPSPPLPVVDELSVAWDVAAPSPEYRLVQAMYLGCPDVCPIAMAKLGRIAYDLADLIPTRLRLVSLSVDHDSSAALNEMWVAHGSTAGWSMAALTGDPVEPTLRRLGVWMFRRRDGLINHGVDLFLLDPHGEIVEVLAADEDAESAAGKVRRAIQ